MKKYSFFFLFVLCILTLNAQNNCQFRINATTETGTCYNNCKIQINLVDRTGQPLDISGTDLEDVKYYVIEEHSSDTSLSFSNEFFVRAGTYKAGVQAVCKHAIAPGDTTYVRCDTFATVTLTTSYVTPALSIVSNITENSLACGTVPTLTCENTGRVQLLITGGTFPYRIEVRDEGNNPIDTVEFHDRIYAGEDATRYDYKDYYTIDGLSEGKYYFHVSDGCGYALPIVNETIDSTELPYVSQVCWFKNTGNPSDSNITKIRLSIVTVPGYYEARIPECVEYRFIYPELDGIIDTTEWKHPSGPFTPTSNANPILLCTIFDTAWRAHSYCDIRGVIKVETRTVECGVHTHEEAFEKTYNGHLVLSESRSYTYATDSTVLTPASADCEYEWTEYNLYYRHVERMRVYGNNNSLCNTTNDRLPSCSGSDIIDKRYTSPLTWIYTLADSGDTVKTAPLYNPLNSSGECEFTISRSDLLPFVNPETTPSVIVNAQLVDSKNCLISEVAERFDLRQIIETYGGNTYPRGYIAGGYGSSNQSEAPDCGTPRQYFHIDSRADVPRELNDGCTVELIESPYDNFYNFTAQYNYAERNWTVRKENPENMAQINFRDIEGIHFTIADYGLPSGFFVFRVSFPCGTTRLDTLINYTKYTPRRFMAEEPQYELTTECTEMIVRPVAGAYIRRTPILWQKRQPNVHRDSIDYPENAMFRIISGPTGGYQNNAVTINQTMRITRPGTYVIQMYNSKCTQIYTNDTLFFSGGTIEHEYDIAYTCNAASTEGFVRARGINGTAPYTYKLYSGPDKTGTLLASNQTGQFDNVPIRNGQIVSVESTDQCLASFHVNITVHDLENLHKCWIGGGEYEAEICEGSLVQLHSLDFGEGVTYRWESPAGFTSTASDTSFLLRRGSPSGFNRIQFAGTGCGTVSDSVYIHVKTAPYVHIADDTEFCPGDTVTLTYTATGVGDVHYTIGHYQDMATSFQNYTNDSVFSYVSYSNGEFWVHSVQDDRCTYSIPADTVHITLHTKYASACLLSTIHDTVCQGVDATVRARSDIATPYTLNWYEDHGRSSLLKSEVILSDGDYSNFDFSDLVNDTTVYVTVKNDEYCESHPLTIFSQMNMASGHTILECGKSILLYDSGGSDGKYSSTENVKHTFSSIDGNPITLTFNSFSLGSLAIAKLSVYSGNTTHPDSLLAELQGNLDANLLAPIVSNGNSLTLWFISNEHIFQGEGWEAHIVSSSGVATASVKVLDSVRVELSPTTPVPVHYNGEITLQAAATGGRGILYQYTWETSADSINWLPALTENADTSELTLNHLTENILVRVIAGDRSPDACEEKDTAYYCIPISDIRLSLRIEIAPAPCSETRAGTLTVRNDGSGNAAEVIAQMRLPEGCIFADANDGWFNIGDIGAGDSISNTFQLQLSPYPTTHTTYTAKAQIHSCLYGDAVADVFWGDWDWNGLPRQADEDTAQFSSPPYSSALSAPIVIPDTVCYMQTSILSVTAVDGGPFPQYINWYSDSELNHYLKTDTLHAASEMSWFIRPDVTESGVFYVKASSDDYCPADAISVRSVLREQTLPDITVISDTVCLGTEATLSASSDIAFPQYYEWWNSSFDSVVFRDTVSAGNVSRFHITNLTTDTSAYVSVSNYTTCPYVRDAFRRRATAAFLLGELEDQGNTTVGYLDSIPFYDDGGPDGAHTLRNRSSFHTFTAAEGAQVVLTLAYFECAPPSYMQIYDGNHAGASQIGYLDASFTHPPRTFTSTTGKLSVKFYAGNTPMRGWGGSITTDNIFPSKAYASLLPAIDTTELHHTSCPNTIPLSYLGFSGIDISVPGEYVIDSVFTAASGCDSVVRLLLTVTDPSTGLSCPDTVVRGLADGETHVLITASELGIPTTSFTPDTLFNNAPSDGRYPLGDHTVTWSAVNECGDTVTCTQCVRVLPPCNDAVDFEGNVYPAIRIGCQCWTQTNIRSAFYSDGTPVASYSSYNGNDSLRDLYGNLYSWYSAVRVPENDDLAVPLLSTDGARTFVQGICPEGWGVPTVEDFEILYFNAGERLALVKEADTRFWVPDTEGETPNSGFNARGGGLYNAALGRYESLMTSAAFWAVDITRNPATTSVVMPAFCDMETDPQPKSYGLSIRCVKNYCGE